jgi:alkylation response protein AidB-like acyl-CoA dehydrogenase
MAYLNELPLMYCSIFPKLATDQFLTHYKRSHVEEPKLLPEGVSVCSPIREALRQYAEVGFFSASFGEDYGGQGLPQVICSASFAYFAAANIATAAYPMLTIANARLITKC